MLKIELDVIDVADDTGVVIDPIIGQKECLEELEREGDVA